MKRGSFTLSIRTTMLLLVLLTTLSSIILLVQAGYRDFSGVIEVAKRDSEKLAFAVASEIKGLTHSTRELGEVLSQLPEVQHREASKVEPLLAKLLSLNPVYANIVLLDRAGNAWASGIPLGGRKFSMADRMYFIEAMSTGKFSAGEYTIGMTSLKHVLAFGFPIMGTDGKPDGCIAIGYDLDYFRNAFEKIFRPANANFILLDHKGIVVFRLKDPEKYIGTTYPVDAFLKIQAGPLENTDNGTGVDGIRRIRSFIKLTIREGDPPFLYVGAGIPYDPIVSDSIKRLAVKVLILLSITVIAVLLAWFIGSRFILDPLSALNAAIARVSKGDFDARIAGQMRASELRNVEPAFDAMALTLSENSMRRKQAEEKLRYSEEMFKVLSDQSPLGKALIDGQGRYEYVNPAFEAIFGYTLQDLPTGSEWFRLAFPDPEKRKEVIRVWKEDLVHVGIGESRPRIFDVACKGRSIKTILFRPVALEGDRQLVIYEDVTERRKMESQLQQAMKMEAVGRLAGGVAHDFNNLLTVITGYSELLLQKIGKDSPMHGEVEEIKRAGDRAASLTQQLLAFSRKQIIEPKVVRLDLLVADMQSMMTRLIGENIALQATTGESLGSVKIDPGQFQQILMNLAVNARDAMPDGGKIVIETANVELDQGYCALHPYVQPGRFVMLAVSDTGHGMSDEIKAHIFEPFFTTKKRGSGTGLGLAMTYGVVHQARGSIEVFSEVGIGTTFKIYLPRVEEEAVKPEKVDRPTDLPGGTETVLLVEDEDTVRNLGVRILERLGYRVLQARNGTEAIALAQGYGDRINLLLTDVVMPGMNGSELATQLVLHHPEMKVLFTSGYTDETISHRGVLDVGVSFIGKPYTPGGLARKVRDVLDKA